MKRIDVGQTIAILANVGVIASIVFLGIELRVTNTQARISATQEMAAQISGWRMELATDSAAIETYVRGLSEFGSLDEIERARFDLLMRAILNRLFVAMDARDSGLVETLSENIEERGLEGQILQLAGEPGFRAWWEQADRTGLPPTAVPIINDLVGIALRR